MVGIANVYFVNKIAEVRVAEVFPVVATGWRQFAGSPPEESTVRRQRGFPLLVGKGLAHGYFCRNGARQLKIMPKTQQKLLRKLRLNLNGRK